MKQAHHRPMNICKIEIISIYCLMVCSVLTSTAGAPAGLDPTDLTLNSANINQAGDKKDETVFCWAAKNGHLDVVKVFISNGAKINQRCNFNADTALHWAAFFGHLDVVKMLISNGANINLISGNHGGTALHEAAWGGHPKCIEELIKGGAEVNVTNWDGKTPLEIAEGCEECRKILIKAGATN